MGCPEEGQLPEAAPTVGITSGVQMLSIVPLYSQVLRASTSNRDPALCWQTPD